MKRILEIEFDVSVYVDELWGFYSYIRVRNSEDPNYHFHNIEVKGFDPNVVGLFRAVKRFARLSRKYKNATQISELSKLRRLFEENKIKRCVPNH